jgi:Uma2 family endonuclease
MVAVLSEAETPPSVRPAEARVVLHNVSWETYERLLSDLEDCSAPRLTYDPPPELVVEIEITRSAIRKFPIFAKMGVPEVWRYDGNQVTIHLLRGEAYFQQKRSRALPRLTSDAVTDFLNESRTLDQAIWLRKIRKWVRAAKKTKKVR